MKKKKILPIDLNPFYRTYGYLWFPNGIIMANFDNSEDWIISNNINLGYSNNQLKVYDRESSFLDSGPLIIQERIIHHYDLITNPAFVLHCIEDLIDSDYYIEGFWNEKAISVMFPYKKYDFYHSYYLYGYDNEKKDLYAVGYTYGNQFSSFIISYDEYLESLLQYSSDRHRLIVTSVNRNYTCQFDRDKVLMSIDDFLNSKCRFVNYFENDFLGFDAQLHYIDLLRQIAQDGERIDLRNSRLLMEYKNVFSKAVLRCFFDKHRPSDSFEELYRKYVLQHSLSLKYNITQKKEIIERLISLLIACSYKEKEYLMAIRYL